MWKGLCLVAALRALYFLCILITTHASNTRIRHNTISTTNLLLDTIIMWMCTRNRASAFTFPLYLNTMCANSYLWEWIVGSQCDHWKAVCVSPTMALIIFWYRWVLCWVWCWYDRPYVLWGPCVGLYHTGKNLLLKSILVFDGLFVRLDFGFGY